MEEVNFPVEKMADVQGLLLVVLRVSKARCGIDVYSTVQCCFCVHSFDMCPYIYSKFSEKRKSSGRPNSEFTPTTPFNTINA